MEEVSRLIALDDRFRTEAELIWTGYANERRVRGHLRKFRAQGARIQFR